MKKEVFLKHLKANDCYCVRQHKGSHAFYRNAKTGASSVVPIHSDIKEFLLGASARILVSPTAATIEV